VRYDGIGDADNAATIVIPHFRRKSRDCLVQIVPRDPSWCVDHAASLEIVAALTL
jgi:hypothetical protein